MERKFVSGKRAEKVWMSEVRTVRKKIAKKETKQNVCSETRTSRVD